MVMCGYVVLEYHSLQIKPDTFQTYRLAIQVAHQFVGVVARAWAIGTARRVVLRQREVQREEGLLLGAALLMSAFYSTF